jgi:hypothetical protein
VDGDDTLVVNPIPIALGATSGKIVLNWTPRHDAANLANFGITAPNIGHAYYGANDSFRAYCINNVITLWINIGGVSTTNTWDCTGAIVADTTYEVAFEYNASQITFSVDGSVKITVAPGTGIDFGTNIPNVFYAGTRNNGDRQADAVFS